MKQGKKNLQELAQELQRQADAATDYIADTSRLEATFVESDHDPNEEPETSLALVVPTNGDNTTFPVRPIAERQIAQRLGIPSKYFDRMKEQHPELLLENINGWMMQQPENRLLRTMFGNLRAFLSDVFRPLDNLDCLAGIVPILGELDVEVTSMEVTEKRMYLKFVSPRLQGDVKVGDTVQCGGIISNSEVGYGTVRVARFHKRLVCTNGMMREDVFRQAHLGKRLEGVDEESGIFWKDDTRMADDQAFFLKLRDIVASLFSPETFEQHLQQYREAQEVMITAPRLEAVEVLADRYRLPQRTRDSVLEHLLTGGDLSKWGLANAVTRTAQEDYLSYDDATDMERLGGKIIELPKVEWGKLNKEAQSLADSKVA